MENGTRLSVPEKLALAALASLLALLVNGYAYELSPNVQQTVPFIARFMDGALFPVDRYAQTAGFFPSLFPRLMALAGKFVPLYPLHFTLFLAFKALLFYVTAELGLFFFGTRAAAAAGVLLTAVCPLTNYLTFLGEDPLMKNSFFPTSAAAPFIMLCVLLLLRGRTVRAFALAAAAYYINGLPVNYLLAAFACATAAASSRKQYFRGWAVFALLVAPWLWWYFTLAVHNPYGGASPDFDGLLRYWYSGHYFMSAWPARRIAQAIVYAAFGGLFIRSAVAAGRPGAGFLKALSVSFLLCVAGAFVFGDLIPVRFIITLQLYRADSLFDAMILILAGGYAARLFRRDGGWLKTALLANVFSTHLYSGLAWLAFGVFAAYELSGARQTPREKLFVKLGNICAGAGVAAGFYAAAGSAANPLHCAVFATVCALILLDGYRPVLAQGLNAARKKAVFVACAALLPLAPLMIGTVCLRGRTNKDNDWIAAQKWAGQNTSVTARFLTPPGENGFRVFSSRSPVIEWLDAAAMHWTPGFEKQWYEKITALGALLGSPGARVTAPVRAEYMQPVTAQSILRAAAVTRAEYIVTLSEIHGFPMPPVYSNKTFAVYRTADSFEMP
ncbi:MAG: hypothetical protein PHW69_07670 [Elusimicrobiaceae bacterium]|nr:hypothetical protein [Elusimicrobiaceae bacterium]